MGGRDSRLHQRPHSRRALPDRQELHAIQFGAAPSANVIGFEVSHAHIEKLAPAVAPWSGLYLDNAYLGTVTGNYIIGFGGYGVEEAGATNVNAFIGNHASSNTAGPVKVTGASSEAIRNVGSFQQVVQDTGGFRQTVDGWKNVATLPASGTVELGRNGFPAASAGRFRAPRAGSITGLVLTTDGAATTGSMLVTVWIKTGGYASTAGTVNTGFTASITAGQNRGVNIQGKDLDPFNFGDEIYIEVTANNWNGGNVLAAVEVET